jgi:hypothetical protein
VTQLAIEIVLEESDSAEVCPTCQRDGPHGPRRVIVEANLVIRDGEFQVLCVGCEEPVGPADLMVANGLPVTVLADDHHVLELIPRAEA